MENVLPTSLTHLIFGNYFNQNITKNVLPNNLTHLTFGDNFNKVIKKDVLPTSLTHLVFSANYCQTIEEFPPNLTYFIDGYRNLHEIPTTLKVFGFPYFSSIKDNLPNNIERIIIFFNYNNNDNDKNKITNIPSTVKEISIYEPFGCKDDAEKFIEKIPFDCIITYFDTFETYFI
jgi:hypothetical protein